MSQKSSFKITPMDQIMTVFVWESSRMIDGMNKEQKTFVRSMLNKYQMWVITEPGYQRNDQKDRVKHLVGEAKDLYMSEYKSASQFHEIVEISLNNDLRMLSSNPGKERRETIRQPSGVAVMGFDNDKYRVKFGMTQEEDDGIGVTRREKRVLKSHIRRQLLDTEVKTELTNKEMMERMMGMMQIIQEKIDRQDQRMEELVMEVEGISGTNTQMDGQDSMKIHRANREMVNDLKKLTDMHVKGQDITQVAFADLPQWFRNKMVGGLKRTAIGTLKLPYKGVKAILTDWGYKPTVMVCDFWKGKLQFILGHIYWFFIIGGVIYVYVNSDYQTVNEFYQAYGGEIINRLVINPAWTIAKSIADFFPGTIEILNGILKVMWEKVAMTIWGYAKSIPVFFIVWVKEAVKEAVKTALKDMLPSWLS